MELNDERYDDHDNDDAKDEDDENENDAFVSTKGNFPTLALKAEEPLTFIVHINGHIIELFGLDITKLG